ncbi:unnamed protein product [Linum tenue]|uniref:Fe2OG dioxygenase domain-containing protein n=1 Tax=Linum tenue TaxID=586396 RepID=A0AAV0JG08_9ROSI|nr:unnamed protein product [Linum tenue]
MAAAAAAPYDRIAELKAFDESKAGVKGLADAGITELPRFFHAPPHLLHDYPTAAAGDPNFVFPVIDLEGGAWEQDPGKRKRIVAEISDASANWGFFQVVNHGFPASLVAEMKAGAHRFFELDVDEKKQYYSHDMRKKVVHHSNLNIYTVPTINWRDTIMFQMAPDPPEPEELPACCRDVVTEYSREILKFGELLFQLLSEALGLKPDHLKEMGCAEGVNLLYNYYPACPQPELTLGTTQHADVGFISLLVQDHIGGLQVLHRDHWVDVPPDSEGIVVNIANLLQVMSNDRFTSVKHRALVKSVGPRASVVAFFGVGYASGSRVYGPIEELVSEENPPRYRKTTVEDFLTQSYKQGLNGMSFLDNLRLVAD